MSERERLSGLWNDRHMTLEQLDSWVREFGEGCDDGQTRFMQFVEHCLARTGDEIAALTEHRRVVKYLREYQNLVNIADNRERSRNRYIEAHPFQPMDHFDEFCYYCNCRQVMHDPAHGVGEAVEYEEDEEY